MAGAKFTANLTERSFIESAGSRKILWSRFVEVRLHRR